MKVKSVIETRVLDLESRLEETSLKLSDLSTMATLVTSLLDIESILSVAMEMAIRMAGGEVGAILIEENNELVSRITWGVDDALVKSIRYRDGEDVASFAFHKQTPVVENAYNFPVEHGPRIESLLAMPISSRARCHGTILIINKTSGTGFTDADKENLKLLAQFAAIAIDNSMLLKESLVKQKMEQELVTATEIQSAILPDKDIKINGVEIGTLYIPARQVGGDFYDIIRINDDEFMIVIGDVSNKGVPAALVMSATIAIIRSQLTQFAVINPSDLMSHINKILCTGIIKSESMFVTLFIARFDLARRRLVYCNAGHPPPMYWNAREDKVKGLKIGGPFVGQFDDIAYKLGEEAVENGDHFFAFTDGLTEATDAKSRLFGLERAKQVFMATRNLTAQAFCEQARDYVERFSRDGDAGNVDDLTILKIIMRF